jgi:asparagine synthetase B (glutamine-hydrolysing)
MCGIAGIFQASYPELQTQIRRMTATLVHRGPDSDGIMVRGDERLAFGHRRLAIQDLSQAGAQPMSSPSGRYTIVYNGEIYNAEELKSKLPGNIQWRGHSDTEILLCAFEQLGVVETIRLAVGMFAIALYDTQARKLYLTRDRFGEKPLYYAMHRGGLVAQQIGTNHAEYYVSANDALSLVEKLPAIFDEPFADSSQLPTLLLSQMAARSVKVALSGDAGDELFAGYARYRNVARRKPSHGMRLLSSSPKTWSMSSGATSIVR